MLRDYYSRASIQHFGDHCFYKDSAYKRSLRWDSGSVWGDNICMCGCNSFAPMHIPTPRLSFTDGFLGGLGMGLIRLGDAIWNRIEFGNFNFFNMNTIPMFGNMSFYTYPGFGSFNFPPIPMSMQPFNYFGDLNGTSNNGKTSGNSTTGNTTIQSSDIDAKKIADYQNKVTALENKTNPTLGEIKALYNEVKTAKEQQDDYYKADNTRSYDDLLSRLETLYTAKGGNKEDLNKAAGDGDGKGGEGNGSENSVDGDNQGPKQSQVTKPEDAKTKDDLDKLLEKTSDENKTEDFIAKIPENVRKTYYLNEYTNYDESDKDKINGELIIDARDQNGKDTPRDVKKGNNKAETEVTMSSDGKYPKTITIHDDKADVTYTFIKKAGCEYLYKSNKSGQIYALQKGNDGKYHLMQYQYMKGYDIADVKVLNVEA